MGRRPLPGIVIVATACVAVVGARSGDLALTAMVVSAWSVLLIVGRRARPAAALGGLALVVVAVVGAVAAVRGRHAVDGLVPERLGPVAGWIDLVDDPQPYGRATRVVVSVDGERFELWLRRYGWRQRADGWNGGDRVLVAGERVPLPPGRAERVAWEHVVGELRLEWVSDVAPGGPLARSANRVRAAVERGASSLPAADAALLRGLVIGDDRDQSRDAIERFRAAGLSHLTAVSGQNVAFVLAAAGPLLAMLGPWARWAATLALIAWFACVTRFEPSILRAGVMAAISATGHLTGRDRAPPRLLCLTVAVLVVIDPLLTRSIGFWLSVGATAGVAVLGPWLTVQLRSLGPLAAPLAITLGAQVGVALPALAVFGRLPLVSVPANLLAVPVAGFVMLYGLPACLLAGFVPSLGGVLLVPCRVGVRWIDTVSVVAARLEPSPPWPAVGWVAVVVVVAFVALRQLRRSNAIPNDVLDPHAHRAERW